MVGFSVMALGCASAGPGGGGVRNVLNPFARAPETDAPWQILSTDYPSQRLYRVKYQGPEGALGFKLVLYLESAMRYRLLATDLGRKLWSLSVESESEAVWVDYRQKEYCRAEATGELRFVPLADLPLIALPKLLLGRLPSEPASELAQDATRVAYRDARGQLWNAGLALGEVEWWSLFEGEKPVVWWRRQADEGEGSVFIDRRRRQEVRWRETVRESLLNPLEEIEIPPRFAQGSCDAAAR